MRGAFSRGLALLALQAATLAAAPAGAATRPDRSLHLHALILRAEDERDATAPGLGDALGSRHATLRSRALRALGRIGDPRSVRLVTPHLTSADPSTRHEAAFALGEIESPTARVALGHALADRDPVLAGLAAEALSKLAWRDDGERRLAGAEVVARVLDGGRQTDGRALVRALLSAWRFGAETPGFAAAVRRRAGDARSAVADAAVYAAYRSRSPELVDVLEDATGAEDPWRRSLGARGLGGLARALGDQAVPPARHLDILVRLSGDPAPGVRVEALRSLAAFPAPAGAPTVVGRGLADADPHVVRTACELAEAWSPHAVAGTLHEILTARDLDLVAEAAAALASIEGEGALETLEGLARDERWPARAGAAGALAGDAFGASERGRRLQDVLLADDDPRVLAAALGAAVSSGRADAAALAVSHLSASDVVIRAIAASLVAEIAGEALPRAEAVQALRRTWRGALDEIPGDARLAALEALATVLQAGAREDLLGGLRHPDHVTRLLAHRAWQRVLPDDEPPPVGVVGLRRPLRFYRELAAAERDARPARLVIDTEAGVVEVDLFVDEAPMTVRALSLLAESGYFDGLTFHRVVPDFVAQGGCPRGDGWGGPRDTLRCEINGRRYDRGAAGMALSGKDTGGSQFFFTLSPQPHLDGRYTVFGGVRPASWPVMDRLRRFDRIQAAWIERGPRPADEAASP